PDLVRPRGQAIELAVGDAGKESVQPGHPAVELHRPGPQARRAHQPLDPPPTAPRAGGPEALVDPRAAIRPATGLEQRTHQTQQAPVLFRTGALAPMAPRVVASAGDAVECAHPRQRKASAFAVNER